MTQICCRRAYICPTSREAECRDHGGFDHCCLHPDCPSNIPWHERSFLVHVVRRWTADLAADLVKAVRR
jgi:hypothetical protein